MIGNKPKRSNKGAKRNPYGRPKGVLNSKKTIKTINTINTINTKLIVPQNMYFIIKKFNDIVFKHLKKEKKYKSMTTKIIKSKLGLTPQQYGNLLQASDTGTWKNFNQWYEEVCYGPLVSSKIGQTLSKQTVYNATLVLVKFGKKHRIK